LARVRRTWKLASKNKLARIIIQQQQQQQQPLSLFSFVEFGIHWPH
jgi:hypothetical protein